MIETPKNEIFNVSTVSSNDDVNEVFNTSINTVDATESSLIIKNLANATLRHRIIAINETSLIAPVPYVFNSTIDIRYDFSEFKRLLIDSKTTSRFTKSMRQLQALQHLNPSIKFDPSTVESASFIFEMNSTVSIESVNLKTSIEPIIFHIIEINIFFLLSLTDLDKTDAYFNNVINRLIQKNQFHSIVRRYGHVFLMWHAFSRSIINESLNQHFCFLIEMEIRRLHRRFDHFFVRRLHQILKRTEHDVDVKIIQFLIKYCQHCQKFEKFSKRFNFILRNDDVDFNFNVTVDIFYIQNKPILHFVNETTRFQTNR